MPKCIWCGATVVDGRRESGSRTADWMIDGDFGCENAPATGQEGTDSHEVSIQKARKQLEWASKNAFDDLLVRLQRHPAPGVR